MKTTQVTINEALSETVCKSNQKKLTCIKSLQPGSTQGNCPFDGAIVSVGAIIDAVHLVHGLFLVFIILGQLMVASHQVLNYIRQLLLLTLVRVISFLVGKRNCTKLLWMLLTAIILPLFLFTLLVCLL
ncbi:MAG: hypothetical protein V7K60_34705 [Nostoc sp.]